jgi:DNA-binding transcriptional ArsR family regulator
MREENVRRITDVASLKAVAHPLRLRLLASLRMDGPATATELARKLDESSGATSYHLRQLAKYGFIEEDPEQPNARDRRWRAAHRYTSWSDSEHADEPEWREASRWMRLRQREVFSRTAEGFEEAEWDRDWLDAAGQSDDRVPLTAASLRELTSRFHDLIQEYAARDAKNPEAETVAVFWGGFPTREGVR